MRNCDFDLMNQITEFFILFFNVPINFFTSVNAYFIEGDFKINHNLVYLKSHTFHTLAIIQFKFTFFIWKGNLEYFEESLKY